MPCIVGYSASEATNLSYSATVAIAAIVGEIRFFLFLVFNI